MLEIELTETAEVLDVALAKRQLERLGADGVALALDDFGAGYSGVKTLAWFPASAIKIDRSLVEGIEASASQRVLVGAIVALAHQLQAVCVAEGVENHSQLAVLTEMGCDQAQGFVFGEPVSADALKFDFACHRTECRATHGRSFQRLSTTTFG